MAKDRIIIRGARENNLKNINLEIPRDKLIVLRAAVSRADAKAAGGQH